MGKQIKKLTLNKETVSNLNNQQNILGGGPVGVPGYSIKTYGQGNQGCCGPSNGTECYTRGNSCNVGGYSCKVLTERSCYTCGECGAP